MSDPSAVQIALADAESAVSTAADRLCRWYAGPAEDTKGDIYVTAGQDATTHIDAAITALYAARAALVTERRRDEDQHAARVEAMLAEHQEGGGS